jgi:hypothetical protein
MPQLKHLARFTTPVNLNSNDAKDTPITETIIKPTPTFTDIVHSILAKQTQPLSVIEITELVSRETDRSYDETYIRLVLKELHLVGKLSSRQETVEERNVRAQGGAGGRSMRAKLFWSPAGTVPARTIAEAVPGMTLYKPETFTARKTYRYKTKRHALAMQDAIGSISTALEAQSPTAPSNSVIDYLIEKMVAERTADLQAQLDAANAKMAKLQELFKSAL